MVTYLSTHPWSAVLHGWNANADGTLSAVVECRDDRHNRIGQVEFVPPDAVRFLDAPR
jgi:hypothetical protein